MTMSIALNITTSLNSTPSHTPTPNPDHIQVEKVISFLMDEPNTRKRKTQIEYSYFAYKICKESFRVLTYWVTRYGQSCWWGIGRDEEIQVYLSDYMVIKDLHFQTISLNKPCFSTKEHLILYVKWPLHTIFVLETCWAVKIQPL